MSIGSRHIPFAQVVDLVEGRLSDAAQTQAQAHTAACSRCAAEVNRLARVIELMRTDTGERIKMIALFGTDSLGRDVYSRVIYGTRVSLIVGIAASLAAIAIGTMIGLVSGYSGARTDLVIQRVMDGLMAFPTLVLALAVVAALGPRRRPSTVPRPASLVSTTISLQPTCHDVREGSAEDMLRS